MIQYMKRAGEDAPLVLPGRRSAVEVHVVQMRGNTRVFHRAMIVAICCSASAVSTAHSQARPVALTLGQGALVIGADRLSAALLARVKSIVVDSVGRIYVAFSLSPELLVVDHRARASSADAARLITLPRVRGPARLVFLPNKVVAAVDQLFGLVPVDPEPAKWRDVRPAMAVTDGCMLDDSILFLGSDDATLLHYYSLDGQRGRSFGAPPSGRRLAPERILSSGVMACDQSKSRAIVGFRFLGEVRAIRTDGLILWKTRLPGFVNANIDVNRSSVSVALTPTATHFLESVWPLSPTLVLVQATVARRGLQRERETVSWLLDAQTGHVRGVQYELPLVRGLSGTKLYVVEHRELLAREYNIRSAP